MAAYINALIPFVLGLIAILVPDKLIPPTDPNPAKKKIILRRGGYLLIGVSVIYLLVLVISHRS